jgi:CRISPR/Cas system-associated exonuclease Cas4 (RecB family)
MTSDTISTLKSISPSTYFELSKCALKVVYNSNKPTDAITLPSHVKSYLGTITHKMLESIQLGHITNDNLMEKWYENVKEIQQHLYESGNTNLKIDSQQGYADSFSKIKSYFTKISSKSSMFRNRLNYDKFTEKLLVTDDGRMKGKVDLIKIFDSEVHIYDYKTGQIFDHYNNNGVFLAAEIKQEYKDQMMLYKALYYRSKDFGKNSKKQVKLFLIDHQFNNHELNDVTNEECDELYNNAINKLDEVNRIIEDEEYEKLAKPEQNNCKYCVYRPVCGVYQSWKKNNMDSYPYDLLSVTIRSIFQKFGGKQLVIQVEDDSKIFAIRNIDKNLIDSELTTGDKLNIYNLKPTKYPLKYDITPYSKFFKI